MAGERDLLDAVLLFEQQERLVCSGAVNTAFIGYRELGAADYFLSSGNERFSISKREFGGLVLARFGLRMDRGDMLDLIETFKELEYGWVPDGMLHLPFQPLPGFPDAYKPALQGMVSRSSEINIPSVTFNLVADVLKEYFVNGVPRLPKGIQDG